MFRYSPYWVKPIVQDPLPTPFGGALVWLDYGYFRPDETNKLCFVEPNELGLDQRVLIKGIDSDVNLKGSSSYPAKIIHDYVNDNILVLGTNGLSSFDPRTLVLNWNMPLTEGQFSFCGNTLISSAISPSYVWLKSSTKLLAYNLLDGTLAYDLTISGTHNVVGGTVPISLPVFSPSLMPVADDMFLMAYGYLNAHNGAGASANYQMYRLTPTSSTTFIIEALPITGTPGVIQTFPLPGFDYEVFVFMLGATEGQTAIKTFNLQTGIESAKMVTGAGETWSLLYMQLDCVDITSNKVWISGSHIVGGVTKYALYEFTYPGFQLLGSYGGRIQQSGLQASTTVYVGDAYHFYVIGSYIYGISSSSGNANSLYLWDVGDYSDEPTKVLPSVEGTRVQTSYNATYPTGTVSIPYPEEYVTPMNIYFPKIPPFKVTGSTGITAGYSNVLGLRPTSKIITQALPGLNVPAVAGTLSTANPVTTVTLWEKVTWVQVELDGINTAELQVVNDGSNETAYGWLYDETGKQVTYNKAFPLVLGDMIEAGTYYLGLVNVKGDTTSLIAPSNSSFRVTISNSPEDVIQHDLTVRLVSNYK